MGEGVKGGTEYFCGDLDTGPGDCDLIFLAGDPEYGGLGGTGGQNCFPIESENVVSRLQLLGAGLTTLSGMEMLGSLRGREASPAGCGIVLCVESSGLGNTALQGLSLGERQEFSRTCLCFSDN